MTAEAALDAVRRGLLAAALMAALPVAAADGTITLIVPFAPGGIADLTARAVTKEMSALLRQPIVVDNKPSAGAIVGSQQVARAAPDGLTLLLMSNANAVSAGSTQQLSAEYFKSLSGIDAVIVPYKSTPAVITALRSGEIDVGFEILGPMLGQLLGEVVRALAVTSDRRFAALPEVPTVKESGLASYDVASWNALAAPARTPRAVVERLQRAALQALAMPSVQSQLQTLGVRAQGGTPERMRQLLSSEIKRWSEVIVQAKIERQ
jgi:tripartite-type tricarboxylate transporter receptor subunit TctC